MAHPGIKAQASRLARDLTLNSPSATKTTIPRLVYGTAWKKERTEDLVYQALKNGFRGIDTAAQPKHYNEAGVGAGVKRAVADGIVKREDLYIQTKFTAPAGQSDIAPYGFDAPLPDKVHQSVRSSLQNFTIPDQEPYFDSLVMHSPLDTLEDTLTVWRTLESYVPNTIRNLGISNVTLPILKAIVDQSTIKPTVVQNRFHDRTGYEVHLRKYCGANDIVFQSFWTLSANPDLVRSAPVAQVARDAGVDPAAAYYALVMGLGKIIVLDGTTSEEHMRSDLEGIEKVGWWAEGDGTTSWTSAIADFRSLVGDSKN